MTSDSALSTFPVPVGVPYDSLARVNYGLCRDCWALIAQKNCELTFSPEPDDWNGQGFCSDRYEMMMELGEELRGDFPGLGFAESGRLILRLVEELYLTTEELTRSGEPGPQFFHYVQNEDASIATVIHGLVVDVFFIQSKTDLSGLVSRLDRRDINGFIQLLKREFDADTPKIRVNFESLMRNIPILLKRRMS